MPKSLKEFLESLNRNDFDEVWEYLDSCPDAITEMIEVIGEHELKLRSKEFNNG